GGSFVDVGMFGFGRRISASNDDTLAIRRDRRIEDRCLRLANRTQDLSSAIHPCQILRSARCLVSTPATTASTPLRRRLRSSWSLRNERKRQNERTQNECHDRLHTSS